MTKSTVMRIWGWLFTSSAVFFMLRGDADAAMNFVILAYLSFLHADVIEGKAR
jgi:hypothetical protein